ncbi:MAG: hypothetical protein Q7J84_10595 [Sulfuricaulis sp.]|nr:hypothetical protein [Sulfuricaulis sp.]
MSRKPFDLEAAKRGEPCGFQFSSGVEERRFIGVHSDGDVVYESNNKERTVQRTAPENFSMLPRKVVKYGVMALDCKGESVHTSLHSDPQHFGPPASGFVTIRVEWEE